MKGENGPLLSVSVSKDDAEGALRIYLKLPLAFDLEHTLTLVEQQLRASLASATPQDEHALSGNERRVLLAIFRYAKPVKTNTDLLESVHIEGGLVSRADSETATLHYVMFTLGTKGLLVQHPDGATLSSAGLRLAERLTLEEPLEPELFDEG